GVGAFTQIRADADRRDGYPERCFAEIIRRESRPEAPLILARSYNGRSRSRRSERTGRGSGQSRFLWHCGSYAYTNSWYTSQRSVRTEGSLGIGIHRTWRPASRGRPCSSDPPRWLDFAPVGPARRTPATWGDGPGRSDFRGRLPSVRFSLECGVTKCPVSACGLHDGGFPFSSS